MSEAASGDAPEASTEDTYKLLINQITLGLVEWLKKQPNVCSVKVSDFSPLSRNAINAWEQKHMCLLPDDLKSFYRSVDGFTLNWSVNDSSGVINVGRVAINSLENLVKVAGKYDQSDFSISLGDLDSDEELLPHDDRPRKPKFNEKSRIFVIDQVPGYGRVCLTYKNTRAETPAGPNPEIWFLDRSLSWHYLAPDFSCYFRLMIMHIGLPEWHFLFTRMGISNGARQWFNCFCPTRLSIDEADRENQDDIFDVPAVSCKFDVSRVIKGKSRTKTTPAPLAQKPKKTVTPQSKSNRVSSASKK